MRQRLETTLEWTPVIVAVAAALFWLLWTLLLWSRWHPHMPWRDLFVILDDLRPLLDGGAGWRQWLTLLEPHYAAHRIALPRLLVALDTAFFHGWNHLLYASATVSMLTITALYTAMARDYFGSARGPWLFCCGLLGIAFLAPANLWNLVNPINTSWHLSIALAALGFTVLVQPVKPPGVLRWLSAYLLVTLAALTTFVGVVAWVLLPVLAIPGRRWILVATVVASAGLVWAYSAGITSDAAIAAAWEAGDPGVAAELRRAGEAAMAANSPWRILQRTMVLLSWPLSMDHPALAGALFACSLVPLCLGWLTWCRWEWGGRRLHPWLRLCLLLATLALGVALAVQLGRLIEQPNYAHGPSYERYNTLVATYWAAVLGLALSQLWRLSPAARSACMTAVLAVLCLLAVPGGDYLQQEMTSLQSAAQLYARGEMPALRRQVDGKLLRFKPEYVYSFDSFFRERGLAYAHSIPSAALSDAVAPCPPAGFDLALAPASRPGIVDLSAGLSGPRQLITREILLTANAALYARLYPVYQGPAHPLDLVRPGGTHWAGEVVAGASPPGRLVATLVMLGGTTFSCMLPEDAWRQPSAPGTGPGRTAADV